MKCIHYNYYYYGSLKQDLTCMHYAMGRRYNNLFYTHCVFFGDGSLPLTPNSLRLK